MIDPIASLRRILDAAPVIPPEPLTHVVDENGVVALVTESGFPRVVMSHDTYEVLRSRLADENLQGA